MAGTGRAIWVRVAGAVCALLFLANVSRAQEIDFDLPGGDATGQLAAWSKISGIKIDAPQSLTRGVITAAVKGRMDSHDALDTMIAATELVIVRDDGDTIALSYSKPAPPSPPAPPAPKPPPSAKPATPRAPLDYAKASTEQLIEALTGVGDAGPGLMSMATFRGFIAEDEPLDFVSGILGSPAPVIDPVMRELTRRGPAALPALLRHLNDPRATGLSVGNGGLSFLHPEVQRRIRSKGL